MEFRVSQDSGCLVVRPSGVLAKDTYAELRDHLVKLAVEQPKAVVVDLADLRFDSGPLLSVFVAVWLRTCDWPAVPLALAVDPARLPATLPRFVRVHPTVAEALAHVDLPPPRLRAHRVLPEDPVSPALARAFVRWTGKAWDVPQTCLEDAVIIASELVTNSVVHARSEARLRLELRRGMLTVAVADDSPVPRCCATPAPAGRAAWAC
ncbi:hypothetical protein ACFQV2_06905 [Actinokineospora soli]|uniref:Anti-anti-sigma factor n=1 Tax=Actinokineospora soli TaxID=1048753 RepID=A0ABW2THZ9_9PSEU